MLLCSTIQVFFVFISQAAIMPPSAEAFVPVAPAAGPSSGLSGLRKRVIPPSSIKDKKKSFLPILPFSSFRSDVCVSPFCRDCPPPTLLCSVVGDAADDASYSTGSESDASLDTSGSLQQQQSSGGSWREKLLKASNFASMLCVLDCTILPMVTVILPLFGIVAASPAQMEWLHEAGHQMALYFVMPVGGLATTMNYSNHRKKWIASLGFLGLLAVLVANAGCHWTHKLPGPAGHALHRWLHTFHHGVIHRVTNLAGCALLLFSNFMSRRQGGCKDPHCSHDH